MHDARECSSTRHSAPRPSTKLRRRNEMTHPPRIISRKRLIKPSLETPRSGSIPIDPCWIAYNYVRSRCAYSLSLSPLRRRRPLKIRPERKTCNFDNQSRERRLIFTIQRAAAFIYIYIYVSHGNWDASARDETLLLLSREPVRAGIVIVSKRYEKSLSFSFRKIVEACVEREKNLDR